VQNFYFSNVYQTCSPLH